MALAASNYHPYLFNEGAIRWQVVILTECKSRVIIV